MTEPSTRSSEPSSASGPRYLSLADYLRVLRRRKWLIVAFTIGLAALAALVSLRQAEVYESTAQVVFSDPAPQESPAARSAANAELITRPSISRAVKRELETDLSADGLADAITTQVGVQTNIVSITAEAGDAQSAANIANAFAEQARQAAITEDQREFEAIELQLEAQIAEVRNRELDPKLEALELGNLQDQLAEVRAIQAASESVEIVSEAEPPDGPSSPETVRNTVLGALLGLVLGMVLAFVRDSLDRRVHSVRQISQELDLPVVGRVSDEVMGAPGLVSRNGAQPMGDAEFEAFRALRINLAALKASDGSVPRSVLVTSGGSEEGKSTVSASLASAAAIAGHSVLLVECDLRRPVFEKRLGVARSPGLSDYLLGDAQPREILQTVSLPWPSASGANGGEGDGPSIAGSFVVISAGSPVDNPAELLAGNRFQDFLSKASRAYDFVIFDSSALLPVVDSLEIAPHVDAVLACVRASQTTLDALHATSEALRTIEGKPIGIVVTGIKKGGPDSSDYYYGY